MLSAPTAALLVELTRLGIELQPCGDRMRFHPRSAMTTKLAARVKACKPELLAILNDHGRVLPPALLRVPDPAILAEGVPSRRWVGPLPGDDPQEPESGPRWPTAVECSSVPGAVAELARARDGWMPSSWRNRLLQWAECCERLHPARADAMRRAARLIAGRDVCRS